MRILAFDVEANGLHGEGFAVGAVVIDESGVVLDSFEARCPIQGEINPWVAENVLPALTGMAETFADARELRSAFFAWYKSAKKDSTVVADIGYPVEARFLAACQDDNLAERSWDGPYPLHEVATLLLASGADPDVKREEYAAEFTQGKVERKHHPTWDAEVSALCALKALRALGRV